MGRPSKPAQKKIGRPIVTSITSHLNHSKSDQRYRLKLATEFQLLFKASTAGKDMAPIHCRLSKNKFIYLAYNRMRSLEKRLMEKQGVSEREAKDFIKAVREKFEEVVNLDNCFYERNFTPEFFTWWDDSNQPGLLEDLRVCFQDEICIEEQFKKNHFSVGDNAHNTSSFDRTIPCQESLLKNTSVGSSFSTSSSIQRTDLNNNTSCGNLNYFSSIDSSALNLACSDSDLGSKRTLYMKSVKGKEEETSQPNSILLHSIKEENSDERISIDTAIEREKRYLHSISTNVLHQVKPPFSHNKYDAFCRKAAQGKENIASTPYVSGVLSAVFSKSGLMQCRTPQTEICIPERKSFTCDFEAYKEELMSIYNTYCSVPLDDSNCNYDTTIEKQYNCVDHGNQAMYINKVGELEGSFNETTCNTTCEKNVFPFELCSVKGNLSDNIDLFNESFYETLLNVQNEENDVMSPLSSEDLPYDIINFEVNSDDIINYEVNSDDIEYHSELFDI